ncbi:Alpha/Beta hydrolase protein [Mycotypha africana]|uniref:Alpha/Beta hydrolase protein n=1 Tax=Mycotypha africana TaxID=64632 RepID=UPI002301785B|nr:Alpha/Beta hydrolase protein [Mycotypha africana]KAI8982210.1 Alpha/Beta hydrolase protein [Mycotypha africana]
MTAEANVISNWFRTKDGHELYTKTWKSTNQPPTAMLILVHGFGEHVGRYDRMFTYFAQQGIESTGFDQRGWGETAKKTSLFGNNGGYETALKDIDETIKSIKREEIPLFLMGHSMGGGLILNYLARGDTFEGVKLLRGAIASAPLVTLSMPVPAIKYYPLQFLAKFLPSITIKAGVDPAGISHDEEEIQKYKDDPLVHDYATLATLKGFLDAGTDLLKKSLPKSIKTPILYSHGDADPINSFNGCSDAFEMTSSEDKELKNWKGLYHELHNEKMPERQQVTDYYVEWMKKRC